MNGKLIGFAPITDADRAKAFYADVLGLTFVGDDGFALIFRSGANMVRLAKMPKVEPAQFTILGWETTSIEDDVQSLTSKGVEFSRFGFMEQDALGIWTAPGGDKVAWFKDPDGNTLSLSQHISA
ncbi:VOC family protein [Terriglobus sp. TAA 43]|uniref:VOC family protein n=1 Tax=Terriglobus sp. TAA 43 TaxID=278961 RepID=UPI000647D59D|nr:VOC family protein [Terriglobus sp. TAA 43]